MKKNILLIIITVCGVQSLSAQRGDVPNKLHFDLQIAQHFALNRWSDVNYANDGIGSASVTELRGAFTLHLTPHVGMFGDLGLAVMPAPNMKTFDLSRMPMPNSGTRYYLRETVSDYGDDKASAHFKMAAGLSGELPLSENMSVMPCFGVGGMTMTRRGYDVTLKEEGSNAQYAATYVWGHTSRGDFDHNKAELLGFLTGKVNFKYRFKSGAGLVLGLEYTHFYDTMNFYSRFTHSFNGNIQRSAMVRGNRMNMIGLSACVLFR